MSKNLIALARAERIRLEGELRRMVEEQRSAWADVLDVKVKTEWMTVPEAAAILGLSAERVRRLLQIGHLGGRKVERRWQVSAKWVEFERRRRQTRRARDGARERRGRDCGGSLSGLSAKETAEVEVENPNEGEFDWRRAGKLSDAAVVVRGRVWTEVASGEIWVPVERVALALGICPRTAFYHMRARRIRKRWAYRSTGDPVPESVAAELVASGTRGPYRAMYSLSDVLRLQSARESRSWQRTHSPNDPEWPARFPIYRKFDDIPPNDCLITVAEAAAILEVTRGRVCVLVHHGRLFAWQQIAGRPSCPIYLSANQAWRLARNPERLRKREAYLKGRQGRNWSRASSGKSSTGGGKSFKPNWFQEEKHIWEPPGKALKDDHGEFYSTLQAAEVLEVSRSTIGHMRRSGRLKGYRSPDSSNFKQKFNLRRWWFFKKDDVDALKINSGRLRRRKAYWKWRMPWAYEDSTGADALSTDANSNSRSPVGHDDDERRSEVNLLVQKRSQRCDCQSRIDVPWSQEHNPGMRLETCTCQGAKVRVVSNYHEVVGKCILDEFAIGAPTSSLRLTSRTVKLSS